MRLEMGLGHSLEMRQQLNQELLLRLYPELSQHVGHVERQIMDKVHFSNFEPEEEGPRRYHLEMLRELILRTSETEHSIATSIMAKHGMNAERLKAVIVESFDQEDVSFDIGTKRNVDLMAMVFDDESSLAMTTSLDKEPVAREIDSPSLQEAAILRQVNPKAAWSLQEYLADSVVQDERGTRGFIVKEFLPGDMLGNILPMGEVGPEQLVYLKKVALATGRMIANARKNLGGVPKDSNELNIIISQDEENPLARYCDVEGVVRDAAGIKHEIGVLREKFGPAVAELDQGLRE